jgi:hypothetical protein
VSWVWSDAWVLTAAYVTEQNPASLTDLIGAGDYINHAILMDEELEHALTHLGAAGLTRLEGEGILLTEEGLRLCDDAVKPERYILEAVEKVEQALRRIDLSDQELTPIKVREAAVREAIERYQARAAEHTPELG